MNLASAIAFGFLSFFAGMIGSEVFTFQSLPMNSASSSWFGFASIITGGFSVYKFIRVFIASYKEEIKISER